MHINFLLLRMPIIKSTRSFYKPPILPIIHPCGSSLKEDSFKFIVADLAMLIDISRLSFPKKSKFIDSAKLL